MHKVAGNAPEANNGLREIKLSFVTSNIRPTQLADRTVGVARFGKRRDLTAGCASLRIKETYILVQPADFIRHHARDVINNTG